MRDEDLELAITKNLKAEANNLLTNQHQAKNLLTNQHQAKNLLTNQHQPNDHLSVGVCVLNFDKKSVKLLFGGLCKFTFS